MNPVHSDPYELHDISGGKNTGHVVGGTAAGGAMGSYPNKI